MNRFTHYIFFIFLSLSTAYSVLGQELIEVTAAVDHSVITIGDRVTYSLTIDRRSDLEVHDPGKGTNLGAFEVKDYLVHEPQEKDGRIIEQFDYVISVYDTGRFVIPPFPIAFLSGDSSGQYQFIYSEPLEIYAKSILNDPNADIVDIRPPFLLPVDYLRMGLITLAVLLLLGGLGFAYWWYRKSREGGPVFRKTVIRPAHEIAREALAALLGKNLLAAGEEKQFYSELSDILRRYLEGRYFINAMEETTSEIIASLREAELAPVEIDFAQKALQNCDLVKFAKYRPGSKGADATVRLAEKFIEATKLEFTAVEKETAEIEEEPTS